MRESPDSLMETCHNMRAGKFGTVIPSYSSKTGELCSPGTPKDARVRERRPIGLRMIAAYAASVNLGLVDKKKKKTQE